MKNARMPRVLDVIEACYRVETADTEWLAGIVEAATPLLDSGLGVLAYTYDATDPARFVMRDACMPPGVDPAQMAAYLASVPRSFVERTWLSNPCGHASRIEGFADLAPALAAFGGARDVLALNGREPSGHGVWLGALLPRRAPPAPRKIERLTRLATHLATTYRVRRQLDRRRALDEQAEAVLRPDGRVEHAEGDARDASARDALRRATLRLDRARASTRREDADLALGLWKGMVDARWTLLDHFDHDGRRYVVARRNDPAVNPIGELTLRERQVVGYAALGHDNKVIAYELGLATATVRVLVHRASRKLGVRGRAELIEKVRSARR